MFQKKGREAKGTANDLGRLRSRLNNHQTATIFLRPNKGSQVHAYVNLVLPRRHYYVEALGFGLGLGHIRKLLSNLLFT